MTWKKRRGWGILLGLGMLILVSLFAAPQNSGLRQGSTYSRAPNGYGAWYAWMQDQGVELQRWQKPLSDLVHNASTSSPITLLQVDHGQGWLGFPEQNWIDQGNVLVRLSSQTNADILGIDTSVTNAPFFSTLPHPEGEIKIATSRRFSRSGVMSGQGNADWTYQSRLGDTHGIVVLQATSGQGKIIVAITPHLAANAYQDEPGNFQLLRQLVSEPGHPIWVDEYLHGYKDTEVIAAETSQSLVNYLAQTPLLLVGVQAGVVFLVLLWGLNQRFGAVVVPRSPQVDNSAAYIRALAGVLRKANCSSFVVETIGKAERLRIQRSLGLGTGTVETATLVQAWEQQTGQSASELTAILQREPRSRSLSEAELRTWLNNLQTLQRHLP